MSSKRKRNNNVKDTESGVSFGRDYHSLQVTPDRHQATAATTTTTISTWNVRTMYQSGKMDNILSEMRRLSINIIGVSEVRWPGAGRVVSEGVTFLYSGGTGGKHEHGVGMFLDQEKAKSLAGFWCISDRVMLVRLRGKPFDTVVVQCYAPTSDASIEEMDDFYDELDAAMRQCKSRDIKIIMGDFNAKVGKAKDGGTVGSFGLGERNERGEKLVEWCKENELVITNTFFKHHPRNLYTWKSPGDGCRNQIDFILINQRFRNAVKGVRTYPGADCNTDHVLLSGKIRLKLKKVQRKKPASQLQTRLLKSDTDIKSGFCQSVRDRYGERAHGEATDEWKFLQNALKRAADQWLPVTQSISKNKWMTQEILRKMDERRLSKNDPEKYKQLDKQVRKMCTKAKEEYLEGCCQEIEELEKKDVQMMHEKVRQVTHRKKKNLTGCIKDEDGSILMDEESIRRRWTDYIKALYADDGRKERPEIGKPMEGHVITVAEIKQAMEKMKAGKAAGNDNIVFELVNALGHFGAEKLTEIANHIYNCEDVPNEMLESIFIALPKKSGTIECKNHRTISLMSHVTKIILRVELNRVKDTIRASLSDEQFGYRPGKGTRNAILCLKILAEKCIEKQKDLYICFIDYVKAFDCVKHEELMTMLEELEIDGKDLRMIRNLYWDQKAAIRLHGELGDWIDIQKGVRQGCVLSPDLFNLYSERALSKIKTSDGLQLGDRNYNNLRYADDTALMADSEEKLQELLSIVAEESAKLGLWINCEKTFSMVCTKKAQTPVCRLKVNGTEIKQKDSFTYLGSLISSDVRSDKDIKCRIALAKKTFMDMRSLFCARKIRLDLKKRLLKCYIWSVLMYSSEAWTISKAMEGRLEAAEMWFYRRMLRISWKQNVTNEEVLKRMKTKRLLIDTIRKRQWTFIGHLLREDQGVERHIIETELVGKRAKGRQRMKMLDWMKNRLSVQKEQDLGEIARDRDKWRRSKPP